MCVNLSNIETGKVQYTDMAVAPLNVYYLV